METKKDALVVEAYPTRKEMGEAVAKDVGLAIQEILNGQDEVNIIFAAAPSQKDLYESLLTQDIPWDRINALHMDEYIGVTDDQPQSFRHYLKKNLFEKVPLKSIHYIQGENTDVDKECARYTHILATHKPDIVCMGIGENTHIAFNDPPVADFKDPKSVKRVELDEMCRQQQVNDGCFPTIGDVPTHALTLTIPTLISAPYIFCVVPGATKAQAVYQTLHEDISEKFPSTILRRHPRAKLYLDKESSRLLED
ncbi:glucosamine-6-phosphate deaminase [Sphingobacterium sp. SGG-5]|uniref:glucosamine-6-phosphate deaminase n=1 Tax=Sphingobacterium sp. SGG-5 TaxID=2710881 RepID=UPI00293B9BE4|nr:glucosamine-6-phosphate deaminase [Sphingobacterium sp. SGG-5]